MTQPNELEQLRLALGANEGESTLEALERYTRAVVLGCALKLERHAEALTARPPPPCYEGPPMPVVGAALLGGAVVLRMGVASADDSPLH